MRYSKVFLMRTYVVTWQPKCWFAVRALFCQGRLCGSNKNGLI